MPDISLATCLHRSSFMLWWAVMRCAEMWSVLGEIHQVAKGKGGGHWLVNCESNLLFWLLSFARLQDHIATSQVTLNHEFQAFFAAWNLDRLSKLLEVSANLLKLRRRDACYDLVVLLWNLHVFTLNLHELEIKVCQTVIRTFTLEIHSVCIVLVANLQGVIGSSHFQDLGQRVNVHSQRHWTLALEPQEERKRNYIAS